MVFDCTATERSSDRGSTAAASTHALPNGAGDEARDGKGQPAHAPLAHRYPQYAAADTRSDFVGNKGQISRPELVRLIQQSLYSLGYSSSAALLEKESGIPLQSQASTLFRNGVLDGDWELVTSLLARLQLRDKDKLRRARFLVLQQKFLEMFETGDVTGALKCLRSEMAPLKVDTARLHQLASLIMCSGKQDLLARAEWSGAAGDSRYKLLLSLQDLLPSWFLIPERRLEALLEQALAVQRHACTYHNTPDRTFSLFHNHSCGRDVIPTQTTQVLEAHTDEVWHLQFSHNGRYLASASKDTTVIIWEIVGEVGNRVRHHLRGHKKPLSFISWSPDDSKLLTCGNDMLVKLWDTTTGVCLQTYTKHTDSVTACAWFPDGKHFVSGGFDKSMFLWDIEGKELEQWKGSRVNDLAISEDGRHMVSITSEKRIRVYRFHDKTEESINEVESITSLCLSSCSRYLLVNLSSQEIHLWDLCESRLPSEPAFTYTGQKQGRYVIRSCFGGTDQAFIVSGSEDSQVYLWHRNNGELLEVLPGHSGTVNAVSWNPKNPYQFASASDDHTVRLWGLAANSSARKEREAAEDARNQSVLDELVSARTVGASNTTSGGGSNGAGGSTADGASGGGANGAVGGGSGASAGARREDGEAERHVPLTLGPHAVARGSSDGDGGQGRENGSAELGS
eukprot:jgi/Mesvir1/11199/Mv16593-RA.1